MDTSSILTYRSELGEEYKHNLYMCNFYTKIKAASNAFEMNQTIFEQALEILNNSDDYEAGLVQIVKRGFIAIIQDSMPVDCLKDIRDTITSTYFQELKNVDDSKDTVKDSVVSVYFEDPDVDKAFYDVICALYTDNIGKKMSVKEATDFANQCAKVRLAILKMDIASSGYPI